MKWILFFLFELNLMRRRKWSQNLLEWFLKMYTNRFEHYLWCLIQQNHLKSVFQAINGYWRHFPCTPIVHIHLHPAAHPYAGKISKDSDDFPREEFFRIVPKCTARPLDPGANWENSRKKVKFNRPLWNWISKAEKVYVYEKCKRYSFLRCTNYLY